MKSWRLWVFLFLFTAVLADAAEPGAVFVVPLKSNVSEAQFFFLRRALKSAEREKASAIVIDMETNGGEIEAAIQNMDALLKTGVPTFTYVNGRALSAGALIAMATQKIYMSPTAVIGAAAPVLAGGQELPDTVGDKMVSALSAMARAAAQKNGHNPDVADAFISKIKELKMGDVVLDKNDSLLTLSAQEAVRVFDGKPLLATAIAGSLEEMLTKAGLKGTVKRIEPSGFERLAIWITALSPFLLLGGILGGYIEFKMPGFGIPGIISLICFGLFFTGHYIAGLTGWEVMVFFSIGVLLVLGELLVHPGTILPGLLGAMLIIGSLIFAMVDRWPGQSWWPSEALLMRPLLNLTLAMVMAFIAVYLLAKYLPRTALYQYLVLSESVPSVFAPPMGATGVALQIGATGTSHTPLRPSGKALFGTQLVDVVSLGDFIPPETPVKITQLEGSRVVVERLSKS